MGVWNQTMDLQIVKGVLFQRWWRIREGTDDIRKGQKQIQWRPIKGQGRHGMINTHEKGE